MRGRTVVRPGRRHCLIDVNSPLFSIAHQGATRLATLLGATVRQRGLLGDRHRHG
jgi:hypothetical protein